MAASAATLDRPESILHRPYPHPIIGYQTLMSFSQLLLTLLCVSAICMGQILFKRAALEIEQLDNWLHLRVLLVMGIAFLVYGGATLMWIHLLRNIALTV